ncbi:MAG: hypothetical protein ACYDAY_01615 [Candidatus Dormibacteria bacterium]
MPGWVWAAALGLVVVAVIAVVVLVANPFGGAPQTGPTPSPVAGAALAPAPDYANPGPVQGIQCEAMEQVLFHIHAHLAIFVDGVARGIPEGIGIAPPRQEEQSANGPFVVGGSCYYWLHAHTADGIIHIESPVQRTFTLGDWFAVWGQPLSSGQVGPARGTVVAYLNGSPFTGDPASIPLTAHAVIQLDVGRDVAPLPYTFASGL